MTENELLEQVRRLALDLRLLISHRHDSRRDAAYSNGMPDLVIASPAGRGVIFAELKSADGLLSGDEKRWGYALEACGQAFVVWRPADWDSGEIRARLLALTRP